MFANCRGAAPFWAVFTYWVVGLAGVGGLELRNSEMLARTKLIILRCCANRARQSLQKRLDFRCKQSVSVVG